MRKTRRLGFAPGAGRQPPVLAGREEEQATIASAFDDLACGWNPSADIALVGPRGNGKTAILRWAESEANSERWKGSLECILLDPSCFRSEEAVVASLAAPGWIERLAGTQFRISASVFGAGFEVGRTASANDLLEPVLQARCAGHGIALLIDEAHTLDQNPLVTGAFLRSAQVIAGRGRPLLVVLAGTPTC